MKHTTSHTSHAHHTVPAVQPPPPTSPAPAIVRRNEVLRGLLHRCAQHDEEALARVYDLTCPWVYALVTRHTSSTTEAADAMVAIYSTIWREADRYADHDRSILAWITTIAFQRIGSGTDQPAR